MSISLAYQSTLYSLTGAYALGSIDPSLYKIVDEDDDYEIPMDHIGRVWFAVEYERETEKLLVTLMKAKNLPTRQYGNNSSCDPFIRWESTWLKRNKTIKLIYWRLTIILRPCFNLNLRSPIVQCAVLKKENRIFFLHRVNTISESKEFGWNAIKQKFSFKWDRLHQRNFHSNLYIHSIPGELITIISIVWQQRYILNLP